MAKPESTCSTHGCTRSALRVDHGRSGMCGMHYQRCRVHGDALTTKVFMGTLEERVEFYTDKRGPDECWPWKLNPPPAANGYARVSLGDGRGSDQAYRVVWMIHNGPIPKGMQIDHECHNLAAARGKCLGGPTCIHRRCVNPAHLVLRTPGENSLRSAVSVAGRNARKTHCTPCGLPLSGDNLLIKDGRRVCLNCKRAAWRDWYQRVGKERRRGKH